MSFDTKTRDDRRAPPATVRGETVVSRRLDPPHGESARLAPLPLTIFERYMLAADAPEYPMTFIVRMEFTGTFNPTAFRNALREAISREPLFSSHVADDERGRPCWVSANDAPPWLDMRAWGEPYEFPERAWIDLRRETGLRTWVRYNDERAEVRIQCHHACCDGLAIAQYLEDLLRLYHRQIDPTSHVEPREVDPRALMDRERVNMPWLKRLQSYAGQALGVSMGWLYCLRRPQLWACPADCRATVSDERQLPDYPVQSISATTIANLKRVARGERVSFNELLLGELLLTLDAWQQTHAPEQRSGLLRVLVPIALRSLEHRLLPATNLVSLALLDRGGFQFRRPRLLLWGLHTELTWLRRTFAPQAFLSWLRWIDKLGWLKKIAQPEHCDATICFTNVGRLGVRSPLIQRDGGIVAGGLRLESVHSASPIRRQTPLMITALQYRDALHFVVNYDRRTVDGRAAEEFLAQFLSRLEQRAALNT